MHMAAIGDIHGNLVALEAVLADIDERGVQTVVNTGDCVVGYPWPNETVALLRERGIPTVQGAMDRMAARFARSPKTVKGKYSAADYEALRWTHDNTGSEHLEWLATLPRQRLLTYEGLRLRLYHGTFNSQNDGLAIDDDPRKFQREREAAQASIIVCGRTHRPYTLTIEDTLFVNPGSVGFPPDKGVFASYVLIDTEEEAWTGEIHWVPYDSEPVHARLEELGLDHP